MIFLLVLFLAVLGVGFTFWLLNENKRGRAIFREACSEDQADHFERAAFLYAAAAMGGYKRHFCRRRISSLWSEHEPLDFSAERDEIVEDYCRYESCGEGYYQTTVSEVHRIVQQDDSSRNT